MKRVRPVRDGESGPRWHHLEAAEAVRLLGANLTVGLTSAEVTGRQARFGMNRVTPRPGIPGWVRWLRQFHQPLVYLLLGAGGVTAFLGEVVDAGVILAVVGANAVVGYLQESRAGRAIEALARLVVTEATVLRDGGLQRVRSEELVPGDVVRLRAGDKVPADLRLFEVRGLQVDESALTGESLPVFKRPDPLVRDTVLGDRSNLAFAGTLVTGGEGEGVVWATGDRTESGHIAWLIAEGTELETPLTRKIARFSRWLMVVILGLAVVTFVLGVARGESAGAMFMAGVALAVGAIPEGLPAAVTIVLAIGVSRMAKRRVIIRSLPVVETLGSTTVICSDKTGTLTENQMTVQEIFAGGRTYTVSGLGYGGDGEILWEGAKVVLAEHPALAECLRAGVLCNDAQVLRGAGGELRVQGDPTEAALLVAGAKGGVVPAELHRESPRLDMIPFEPEHMFRATLHDAREARVVYKVGAAERLVERCADAVDVRGMIGPLDAKGVHAAVSEMAGRGVRVLALVRRRVDAAHARLERGRAAADLTFLGLQGMRDPPRPAVLAAVRRCHEAGIAVKMITGDHLATARAVARQIGLTGEQEHGQLVALSGRDLDRVTDEELPGRADRATVFARVAPEQKLRLVRALQARGHVVAMTVDGVNDAPALKQADIGVAMGVAGTDVAKGAAAMVLTDDNFASLEAAVEEGRGVFENITKFIVWILPTNLGEALLLMVALVVGLPLPVVPLQLLWINLTDTLLGLPLAFEPREGDLMRRPPRPPRQPLFTHPLLMRTGLVSLLMLTGGLWLFMWELLSAPGGLAVARTATMNVIVLVEVVYLFNCRSLHRSVFAIGWRGNPWVPLGAAAMLLAQMAVTYVPVMNRLFHTAPLNAASWGRIVLVAAAVFVVVEVEKWVRSVRHRPRVVPPAAGSEAPEAGV